MNTHINEKAITGRKIVFSCIFPRLHYSANEDWRKANWFACKHRFNPFVYWSKGRLGLGFRLLINRDPTGSKQHSNPNDGMNGFHRDGISYKIKENKKNCQSGEFKESNGGKLCRIRKTITGLYLEKNASRSPAEYFIQPMFYRVEYACSCQRREQNQTVCKTAQGFRV
jgi:hypothetical protein